MKEQTPFERFEKLTRAIVVVPKSETEKNARVRRKAITTRKRKKR